MCETLPSTQKKRFGQHENRPVENKRRCSGAPCLGNPLNKYDIDEIAVQNSKGDELQHLASLSLAIPEAQKSLQARGQVSRNLEGRRTFHGAFTGGFTAGYNNTVGSAEGWKPTTFSSSLKHRASARRPRVEDFMDEQDIEDMMSGHLPSAVFHGPDVSTHSRIESTKDLHPFKADAMEFLVSEGSSSGHRILRSMGWREGVQIVMITRPCAPVIERKRRYGPERPSSFESKSSTKSQASTTDFACSDENDDWAWSERRQALFHQLLKQCQEIQQKIKRNRFGLGYEIDSAESSHKEKLSRSNRSFGFGVLHEEEEQEWDDDIDVSSLSTALLDQRYVQNIQGIVVVDGRDIESCVLEQNSFRNCLDILTECPPPKDFSGIYTPCEAERQHDVALRQGSIKGVVASLVEHFQQCRPKNITGSMASKGGEQTAEASRPLWSNITSEAKERLLKSLSIKNRFLSPGEFTQYENIKYVSDPEKQKRYDQFCLALEEKLPASVVLKSQQCLSTQEAEKERHEFGQHYREFRQRCPTVALRGPDLSSEATSKVTHCKRFTFNWDPTRLLCKLYRVPYPWEKKEFVDNRKDSNQVTSLLKENAYPKIKSTGNFVNSVLHLLSDRTNLSHETKKDEETKIGILCPYDINTVRPPLSIFKKVFGGDDL